MNDRDDAPYGPEDLQVLTPLEAVQHLPQFFFKDGEFTPEGAVEHLRSEGAVVGVDVSVEEVDGWWIVSGDDWLPAGQQAEVFNRLMPFPEAGMVNASRKEVLLTAFTQVVLTSFDGEVSVIKDEPKRARWAKEHFGDRLARSQRVIVFLP
jgi:hypothetical protein